MRLHREWQVGADPVCYDQPFDEAECGTSKLWLCVFCGNRYAELRAYKDGKLSTYAFVGGCCLDCKPHGHRWLVPGSLGYINTLCLSWPPSAMQWELDAELAFTNHPEHPHNKVYS